MSTPTTGELAGDASESIDTARCSCGNQSRTWSELVRTSTLCDWVVRGRIRRAGFEMLEERGDLKWFDCSSTVSDDGSIDKSLGKDERKR